MAVILVEPENWKVCMFNNRARLHNKYQYIILFSTKKNIIASESIELILPPC